jgi:hypothetical protein
LKKRTGALLRTPSKAAFVLASSVVTLVSAPPRALGAPMDPAPERLYLQPASLPSGTNCQDAARDPQSFLTRTGQPPNFFACAPNNVAWANMMNELGFAIAPSAFHPARTTGFGGFALSLEATFAHVNADAVDGTGTQYWHAGTRGAIDPSTQNYPAQNGNPDSILQIYTLKARKGLGFGFEVAGALGYVANTSLWIGGADIRWALLEGYRTGVLGYFPDIAIGSGVRTVGGTPSFYLTTVGIDGQVSKPFALADSAVLTPYVGAQRLLIFADSTVVNLTPNIDPLAQCGYMGTNVPGNPAANPKTAAQPNGDPNHAYDGAPVCSNKLKGPDGKVYDNNGDFNNQVTFNKLRTHRWRGIAGVTYRYEVLYLAGQFAFDLTDPGSENNSSAGISGSRQWALSLEAGVFF